MGHSPLPWHANEQWVISRDLSVAADCGRYVGDQDEAVMDANAQFIVTAVNAHHELLAALKALVEGYISAGLDNPSWDPAKDSYVVDAYAAITKAEATHGEV
jgi:hypothetical protein